MDTDQENNNTIGNSSSHNRKCRYRNLLNKVEEIQESEDLGINTINGIGDIFKAVNQLNDECDIKDRVQHADETLLDYKVLSSASDVLLKCIKAVDAHEITYEPTEFALKIVDAIITPEDQKLNFTMLFEDARHIIPDIPNYTFLYGAYDMNKLIQPKEKKKRVKETQEKVQKKELIHVKNVEKEESGIEETLNFLLKVLRQEYENNNNEPIDYFNYLVDKGSFESTVENMFYFSFLLRDGKAKLSVDDGVAKIQPIRKRELKSFRGSDGVNIQMITSITMDMWKNIDITEGYVQKHKRYLKKRQYF